MNQVNAPTIRHAVIEDIEILTQLAAQLGYTSSTEEIRDRFLSLESRKEETVIFVAEINNQVVGWVHVHVYRLLIDAPEIEIGGIVVDKRFRGKGVGAQLIKAAEDWASEQGYSSVYLRSNVIRDDAFKFYKRLGYELVKSQHAFRKKIK